MSRAAFHPVSVTAASARTAVGDDVDQTCASIRAGIVRLREHAFHAGLSRYPEWQEGEPLVVGRVDGVDPMLDGQARLLSLLLPVLADLFRRGGLGRRDLGRCALLVALPAEDAAVARWGLGDGFVPALCGRAGLGFAATRVSQAGHAGALELLGEASALLAGGEVDRCVLAGVDSYLSEDRLRALDAGFRLKSARGVDGFCPGEAAAALLLEGDRRGRARAAAPLARVAGLGLGIEPEPFASERPSTGRGLGEALRAALGPEGRAAWVLCDLNGESYRAFEWGVAVARLGERLAGVRRLVHPASSLGDVGAATGALLVAITAAALGRGYAPADEALLWTSSEGSLRAAARVVRAGGV